MTKMMAALVWSLFYIYICSYLMLMLFGDSDNDGDEGMVHWLN
jgi:hypothetical protein